MKHPIGFDKTDVPYCPFGDHRAIMIKPDAMIGIPNTLDKICTGGGDFGALYKDVVDGLHSRRAAAGAIVVGHQLYLVEERTEPYRLCSQPNQSDAFRSGEPAMLVHDVRVPFALRSDWLVTELSIILALELPGVYRRGCRICVLLRAHHFGT